MAILGAFQMGSRWWCGKRSFVHFTRACIVVAVLLWSPEAAQGGAASEYELKAAFLHRFVSYVEWPEEAIKDREHFVIGVLGDNPFDGVLRAVFADKELLGMPVQIRESPSADELEACHILFVAADIDEESTRNLVAALKESAVLTVGDEARFAESGMIIGFEMVDNRVRFVINADAMETSALAISSRLMQVARVIRPNGARS